MGTSENNAKYYSNLLLNQIKNYQKKDMDKHTDYIAALSQYICKESTSYQYNLTYLINQNETFLQFLGCAHRKCCIMRTLIKRIKATGIAQDFFSQNPGEDELVTVQLNNFLEGDLGGSIRLSENFLISGANRKPASDLFTLCYGKQCRSGAVIMKKDKLETLVAAVLVSSLDRSES